MLVCCCRRQCPEDVVDSLVRLRGHVSEESQEPRDCSAPRLDLVSSSLLPSLSSPEHVRPINLGRTLSVYTSPKHSNHFSYTDHTEDTPATPCLGTYSSAMTFQYHYLFLVFDLPWDKTPQMTGPMGTFFYASSDPSLSLSFDCIFSI